MLQSKYNTRVLSLLFVLIFMFSMNTFADGAKFQQLEADGLVCMEAENYSAYRESVGEWAWEKLSDAPVDFSGDGYMQCFPAGNNDCKPIEFAQENAPVMEYSVNFINSGTHYIWARSAHHDGYDDSVWFGMDSAIEGTSPWSFIDQNTLDAWFWVGTMMDQTRAVVNVTEAGVHIFEVYMREPSYRIDKIVITTNVDYTPEGEGPAETLSATAVKESKNVVAANFTLAQNYPNPFNPVTTIGYALPNAENVNLAIYDVTGKHVATLVNEYQTAGVYSAQWNATGLASGIYFYKLQAGSYSETKKLVLQK